MREVIPITVLVVDDEPEFMRSLCGAVLADPGLVLVATAASAGEAIAAIGACAPDVVLLDLGLPDADGLAVIRHAMNVRCDCDVLVATMFDDEHQVLQAIEAGASGYLLKDSVAESIVGSIRDLRAGGSPISPGIARRILDRFRPTRPTFSEGEAELLRLTAKGLSFDAIGAVLGMSPRTLVAQVRSIYRKLPAHPPGEALHRTPLPELL